MAVPASRVSRVVMTGPLAGFAEAYVLELRRRGYTPLTSVNQLRQVGRLSSWLATQGVGVAELTRERVEEFLAVQRAVGRHRSQWSRPGLLCLMEVLAGVGVIGAEPPPRTASPTDELLESFAHYLRTERALAAGTVGLYVDHARRFLAGLRRRGLGRGDQRGGDPRRTGAVVRGVGEHGAELRRRATGVAAFRVRARAHGG